MHSVGSRFQQRVRVGLLATALTAGSAPVVFSLQAAQSIDICSTGEPQARIAACTLALRQPSPSPAAQRLAYVNRGNAYDSVDQFDLALRDFEAALKLDPNDGFALRSRAAAFYRHHRLDDALDDLTHAVTAFPDDIAALRLRGQLYAEMGQIARAVEDFSKVLDHQPGDLPARQARGLVLAASGDHARAILDFNRILERDPRAGVARAARAFSLFRTGQYRLAVADWDQILARDPEQLPVLYCRGVARLLSGDETGGRKDVETVQEKQPDVAATEAAVCQAPALSR
jgi:tetratricopeptide (TPR) repeat protein